MIPNTRAMSQVLSLESVLCFFGSSITLMITFAFGLYKLAVGEPIIALIDFTICLLFSLGIWLKLRNNLTENIKVIMILLGCFCVLSLIFIKGNVASIYWVYPVVTGIFFLLRSRLSLFINTLFIVLSMSIASLYISTPQLINNIASLFLVCLAGYFFSVRSEVYQKRLTTLVDIDPLTKLNNRHSLEETLINEIILNKKDIQTSSLLVLDLDFFKKINDKYGHTVGDETLISFSDMLKGMIRETDKVYRYGGEEFIIIAKDTRLDKAGKLAENLRKMTEKTVGVNEPVTVSIGIAEVRKDDTDTSWLHRADQALYKAKQSKRNVVFLARNNDLYEAYQQS